ncbi:DUF4190 domain-containing protein [Cellulomonas taurus]|jgi:hypothetical protein|uniref:DUF4190 domain-containing protein n=1 Tax=Cellulomonas taurus TaxID=2729175 RepID=UPI00145D0803|nr:DUF4190 domain-containing protein [Cellulomonas taurus]
MSTPNQPQDPYQPGDGSTGDSTPQYGQTPSYGQYGAPQDPAGGYPSYPGGQGGPQTPMYGFPKNNLAVWSLVLGIVGLLVCGIAGIPAIILGNNSKKAVARGEANNGGMATAGIVLGWISVAWLIIVVILGITGGLAGILGTNN